MKFDIVALVSVICSAVVSIYTIWNNRKLKIEIERQSGEHKKELELLRNKFISTSQLLEKQLLIFEKMVSPCIEISKGNYEQKWKLLSYALQLEACAIPGGRVANCANAMIQSLTNNFHNRDNINWMYLLESCAEAINIENLT